MPRRTTRSPTSSRPTTSSSPATGTSSPGRCSSRSPTTRRSATGCPDSSASTTTSSLVVRGRRRARDGRQDVERLTRPDTTTTVHYLKFTVSPDQQRAFADGPVRIVVDHPEYEADVTLTAEQRDELAGDLAP